MRICPHCKTPILSKWQAHVLRQVAASPYITSRDLATLLKISISQASTTLQKLSNCGLVLREQMKDPTGGYYYLHSAAQK